MEQPKNFEFLTDHQLRSRLIFELIQGAVCSLPLNNVTEPSPRSVIQYWDNLSSLPGDVLECIQSWSVLSKFGIDQHLFDYENAKRFIIEAYPPENRLAFERCRHPAMQSDYFRLCYILKHGGVYIDADEEAIDIARFEGLLNNSALMLQPMCYDITTSNMIPAAKFLDEEFNGDRIYYFNNNPIVATEGNPIIELALRRATEKLLANQAPKDIQSTTGPGNITESLLLYWTSAASHENVPIRPLVEWDNISVSKWPLSYRSDERNWRNWKPGSQ